nr:unnamed protein product [Digitaria exilis]
MTADMIGSARPIHGALQAPSATSKLQNFIKATAGRCFNCLARGHKAASCRDPVHCLRCRRSGHRERFCKQRPSASAKPSTSRTLPQRPAQPPRSATPPRSAPPPPSVAAQEMAKGDPHTRPETETVFIPNSFALMQDAREWEDCTLVPWAMHLPRGAGGRNIAELLVKELGLQRNQVSVTQWHQGARFEVFIHMPQLEDYSAARKYLEDGIDIPVGFAPTTRRYEWRYGVLDGAPQGTRPRFPARLPKPPHKMQQEPSNRGGNRQGSGDRVRRDDRGRPTSKREGRGSCNDRPFSWPSRDETDDDEDDYTHPGLGDDKYSDAYWGVAAVRRERMRSPPRRGYNSNQRRHGTGTMDAGGPINLNALMPDAKSLSTGQLQALFAVRAHDLKMRLQDEVLMPPPSRTVSVSQVSKETWLGDANDYINKACFLAEQLGIGAPNAGEEACITPDAVRPPTAGTTTTTSSPPKGSAPSPPVAVAADGLAGNDDSDNLLPGGVEALFKELPPAALPHPPQPLARANRMGGGSTMQRRSARLAKKPKMPIMAAATTTASICSSDTEKASHRFEIRGYNQHCSGLGIGKYICSTRFTIGGHDWRIRYYPDGATEEFKDYVAVHLELMSELTNVRLLYDFKLRNNQQQQQAAISSSDHHHQQLSSSQPAAAYTSISSSTAVLTSEGPSTTCGTHKFIHKNELANSTSSYLWGDCLEIECEVTVIKDSRIREIAVRSCTWNVQVPPSDLSLHLLQWFSSGQEADITFKVEQVTFRAHTLMLAMRSPIFKQQLYGQGQGQTPRDRVQRAEINIEGISPAVFKALLHFIYTDELLAEHEGEDMAKRLFAAAETYAMGRLKLLCGNILSKGLTVQSVVPILELAHKHQCTELKDACIEFIISSKRRMADVVSSAEYQVFKHACPVVALEVLEKSSDTYKTAMASRVTEEEQLAYDYHEGKL